jgi:hypothetical protein
MPLAIWLLALATTPAGASASRDTPAAITREWTSGDAEAALRLLEARAPSHQVELNRAVALLYLGRSAEAEGVLVPLLERDPGWLPAVRWLARAQRQLGRRESPAAAEALLRTRGAEALDAVWAGDTFLAYGLPEAARASYAEGVRRVPALSLGWLGLQRAETALGRPVAAAEAGARARGFRHEDGVPPPLVLVPGEELRYRVKYLFFRLAELRIATSAVPNEPGVVRVRLSARSNPSIPFFHIDSTFESLIGADGRILSHANLASDSDNGRRSARYEMDAPSGRCIVRWVRDGLFGFDVLPLPDHAHDGVTVTLLLRAVSRSGSAVTVPTAVDGTWWPTTLRAVETGTVRWHGRSVDAVHVQSAADYRAPGGLSGVVDAWVSADERAVPLKAKMKVAVGSIRLELLPPDGVQ